MHYTTSNHQYSSLLASLIPRVIPPSNSKFDAGACLKSQGPAMTMTIVVEDDDTQTQIPTLTGPERLPETSLTLSFPFLLLELNAA
jgi:hypothetical protein